MNNGVIVGVSRDGIGGSVITGLDLAAAAAEAGWRPVVACNADNAPYQLCKDRGLLAVALNQFSGLGYKPNPNDGNLIKRALKRIFLLRAAIRYLRKERPALIHVHDESSALAWGLPARFMKIPMVWHVHQQIPQKGFDDIILKLTSFIVFVSDANRVRFRGKVAPPARTVYNTVDMGKFHPPAQRSEGGAVTIGFISNLVDRKRPDWAVRAVGALVRKGLDVRLVIAGNDFSGGEAAARLERLAAEEGLGERYAYLGFRRDVDSMLREIDILVLPSERDKEAFPRIVVEALATGVPVVATEVAGVPEAVVDGVNGYLVDPDDYAAFERAVENLAVDGETRRAYAQRAVATAAEKFSHTANVSAISAIYAEVTGERSVQPAKTHSHDVS
jgi:glycosyltransferase involved in cell wall biosynthesis